MVTRTLKCSGDNLLVNGTTYLLDHNLHIVAFGKAVAGMVRATKDMRVASVPVGIAQSLHGNGHRWVVEIRNKVTGKSHNFKHII